MSWTPPPRAPWVATLNALGARAGDDGRSLVPLDADRALAAAVEQTGFDDFGGDGFQEGLRVLTTSLEEEARLTLVGRLMARAEIARILESRLRIERMFRDHPEIEDERIAEPLFVTGLARTGTSILHEYLWRDPASRAPLTWEMMYPAAAADGSEAATAAAIQSARAEIDFQNEALPALRTMHEHDAELPNECIYVLAHELACDMFTGFFHVPSYTMWKAKSDPAPWYAYHRRILKLLQWKRPRRRWVLKAPSHMSDLPSLLGAYPDARVVITHRDPLRVLASLANLMASLRWTRSDEVDYHAVVNAIAFGHAYLPERVMQQRDAGMIPEGQIIDVGYTDLVADPIASVRSLYERCDIRFSAEAEHAIAEWIARRPQARHGVHYYAFADTGLDLETERARHSAYQERFDVSSEV